MISADLCDYLGAANLPPLRRHPLSRRHRLDRARPKLNFQVIYDLGCGTGHLTRILADTFPSSKVTGIDSSREMLSEARREFPALNWQQADLTSWRPPAPPHLIYTNAALQWFRIMKLCCHR